MRATIWIITLALGPLLAGCVETRTDSAGPETAAGQTAFDTDDNNGEGGDY